MNVMKFAGTNGRCFQFLGIPPKGEPGVNTSGMLPGYSGGCFQFLGIPPKGEPNNLTELDAKYTKEVSNF